MYRSPSQPIRRPVSSESLYQTVVKPPALIRTPNESITGVCGGTSTVVGTRSNSRAPRLSTHQAVPSPVENRYSVFPSTNPSNFRPQACEALGSVDSCAFSAAVPRRLSSSGYQPPMPGTRRTCSQPPPAVVMSA